MSDAPMDWDSIYRIVEQAQELEGTAREAHVHKACGANHSLREQILKILGANVERAFLEPPANLGQGLFGGGLQGKRLGRFELEREIARGGMGVIYLAHEIREDDPHHRAAFKGESVVVKVLPQIQRGRPAVFERFQREAHAASELDHPHSLRIIDSGETEGIAWYAMPFVQGHDLRVEILAQSNQGPDRLWPHFGKGTYIAKVLEEVAGIADALQGFHDKGITHRDIKPRNLLLDQTGQLILADFGLAKISEMETLTQPGAIQGTPHYMSPEQAQVIRAPIDHRSDIYSLSVVLYELLSLRRPFESDSPEVVVGQIASGMHVPLRKANPRTPRDLILICEKGMAHHPRDRYQSAKELAQDLTRFLGLEAVQAKPAPFARRAAVFARRHRRLLGLVFLCIAVYTAWLASAQWQASHTEEARWQNAFLAITEPNASAEDLRRANMSLAAMAEIQANPTPESKAALTILEWDRQSRHRKLNRLLAVGKGLGTIQGRRHEYQLTTDQLSLVRAHQFALESSRIHPDDADFARHASLATLLPALTIEFDSKTEQRGRAWAFPLDTFSSTHKRPLTLGPLPVRDHPLSTGEWRVLVTLEDGSFFEYDRIIHARRSEYMIQVRPPSSAPSTDGMVLIQPLDNRFPNIDPRSGEFTIGCCYSPEDLPLADYWIDEALVSNGQYLQYLIESGAPVPPLWNRACVDGQFSGNWRELPIGDVGEAWLDLPATGVPSIDAQRYAEFYGKRLAGHYEMEYALRGPELWTKPWGHGQKPKDFPANVGSLPLPTTEPIRVSYQRELRHLMHVREPGYQHAPFGLFHAYGNAAQRTWGIAMFPSQALEPSMLIKRVGDRLVFGESYGGWTSKFDYSDHRTAGQSRGTNSWGIGFRCVLSAQVPNTGNE